MISRREILDIAETFGLRPQIVEKDYVLGWVLAGIYHQVVLADTWVFKGGTCLKKCYFETYRFSEDLDFTVQDPAHMDDNQLSVLFHNVGDWIYEHSGIELPAALQEFKTIQSPRGTKSCQGKLSYKGPIAPRTGGLPRIKLDLTFDEILVLPPIRRAMHHDYSDAPSKGFSVLCYAYEEAFAEKVRALGDRARPRDLYDVVSLFRNVEALPDPSKLLWLLKQKCAHRALPIPTIDALRVHREDLEGSWQPMLGHQLRALPPVEPFWKTVTEFFQWMLTGSTSPVRSPYRMDPGESLLRKRTLRLQVSRTSQTYLEIIRFAAWNRLCVDLAYNGTIRRIEPYSLRST